MHRQQIQFSQIPTAVSLRIDHRGGKVATIGPTEEEIRVSREAQLTQQNERLEHTLNSLQQSVQQLETRLQDSLSDLQQVAVELAVSAASHVVQLQLESGDFGVEELVAGSIARMAVVEPATVRLHPEDLSLLQTRLKQNPTTAWNEELISLAGDHNIDRGAVRLETNSGRVVLSDVMTRLEQIQNEWTENIDDAQTERRDTKRNARPVRRFPDRRETA